MTMPTVGQWVELCQPGGHWVPFLVTHVYDADTVSGVAFSGQPSQVGWHRPVADFAHVTRGENNRQWREVGLVVKGEAGEADIAEAVQAVVADMLPTPERLAEMMNEAAAQAVAAAIAAASEAEEAPAETEEEAPAAADDLTVIPRLGEATAEWLAGRGFKTFADLAAITDDQIEDLADAEDAPQGVTETRLDEWREDAAGRAA